MARAEQSPAPHLQALPQVPQQRDLNWVSWQSFSCFTFSQYLVVSLHSTGKGGEEGGERGQKGNGEIKANRQTLFCAGQAGWGGGGSAVNGAWLGQRSVGANYIFVELMNLGPE